jgi:pimeloyl-ACP methyl ester carboxylesterase
MVALAWAQRHAEEISGCVLINTSLRPFSPFHQRLRPRNYPVLLKRALLGGSPGEWEATILGLTSNLAEDRASILDGWIALRRECPVSGRNALRQLWAASRYRADAKPAARLLVLAGTQDRLVDPRCSRQLASRWGSAFGEHAAAGHDLPLDDGPWVARQVRDWLAITLPSGSG